MFKRRWQNLSLFDSSKCKLGKTTNNLSRDEPIHIMVPTLNRRWFRRRRRTSTLSLILLASLLISAFLDVAAFQRSISSRRRSLTRIFHNPSDNDFKDHPVLKNLKEEGSEINRRLFFGAALLTTAGAIGIPNDASGSTLPGTSKLAWESTPVNKRTGVTVFDAEKAGYNVRFVTYLSRFLLVFDIDCQKWWYSRAQDIPRRAPESQVSEIRLKQFGAFSASVEVGLQEYRGPEGPARLMTSLLQRYCPDIATVREKRANRGLAPLTEDQEAKEIREIKEARRQIALLFGLMEDNQPVEALNRLLAAIDNGSIASVQLVDGGSGYAPGYGPPLVKFPPPMAGPQFNTATGRAVLEPSGRVLRLDLKDHGFGYQKPPTVMISAPGADRGVTIPGARAATGNAIVFKNGPNKGRLDRLQLTDQGEGYSEGEKIRVVISPPELPPEKGGVKATATVVLELIVGRIDIIDGGSGYAIEKPIAVYVEPAPPTARTNMNDPLAVQFIPDPNQKLKAANDPKVVAAAIDKLAKNDGKGGGGGCIGRGCYDSPVVAYGKAQAMTSSFSTFRNETDARSLIEKENAVIGGNRVVSATNSGADSQLPTFWTPSSSSAQLLTLLPAGLGLQYEEDLGRFVLKAGENFSLLDQGFSSFNLPLDPEFGPRGRSPIERDLTLDLTSFVRFIASGAVCASGAHFVLTPLDVVKTKLQTDPANYPGVVTAFRKLLKESGPTGFFAGWIPTFIGFFFWGGFSYSVTELLRRYFNDMLGPQASSLEVVVILMSSAIAAFFSVFILCPFEAVRIRSVYQPDYGKNIVDVTNRIVKVSEIADIPTISS